MLSFIKRFCNFYLSGPDWIDTSRIPVFYKSYRSWTIMTIVWIYALSDRYSTASGRILLPTLVFVTLYASLIIRTPVPLLVMTLFCLLLAELTIMWIFRPRLEIKREVPERVRAFSMAPAVYKVRNLRRTPAWDIEVDPGGVFSRRKTKFTSPSGIECIAPLKSVEIKAYFDTGPRGFRYLRNPAAATSFPFGIFKWSCRTKASGQVYIHPAYHSLDGMTLPSGLRFQRMGNNVVVKIGESLDFAGCREFRTGDDPRHINWPGSASKNELIVKEYQEEQLNRAALILDTRLGTPEDIGETLMKSFTRRGKYVYDGKLEAGISLAAAVSEFLSRTEFIIDIFAAGPEVYHFQGGRGLGHLENILDILACLEGTDEPGFEMIGGPVMEEIRCIGCCVVILLHYDKKAEELLEKLYDSGTTVKAVFICDESGEHPPMPENISIIRNSDIEKGMVTSI